MYCRHRQSSDRQEYERIAAGCSTAVALRCPTQWAVRPPRRLPAPLHRAQHRHVQLRGRGRERRPRVSGTAGDRPSAAPPARTGPAVRLQALRARRRVEPEPSAGERRARECGTVCHPATRGVAARDRHRCDGGRRGGHGWLAPLEHGVCRCARLVRAGPQRRQGQGRAELERPFVDRSWRLPPARAERRVPISARLPPARRAAHVPHVADGIPVCGIRAPGPAAAAAVSRRVRPGPGGPGASDVPRARAARTVCSGPADTHARPVLELASDVGLAGADAQAAQCVHVQ